MTPRSASPILPPQGSLRAAEAINFPMRTPTTHCARREAPSSSGSPDLSPRRHCAALLIGVLALLFALVGPIAVHAEVISIPSADPPSSAASPQPPTVLRGSPPSTAGPVPICSPGYPVSPGDGCIGQGSSDNNQGWPGYDYWPGYGYGYPLGGFPGFGFGVRRAPRFGGFRAGGFHAGRGFRAGRGFLGPAAFHGSARFGGFGAGAGRIGGFGRR